MRNEKFSLFFTLHSSLFTFLFFTLHSSLLQVFHQDIPDCDDVAHGACKDKKVEDGMHISFLVQRIKERPRNITDAFCNNPYKGSCRDTV